MLQEIHPHIFKNEFSIIQRIDVNDYIFHFKKDSFLLKKNNLEFEIPKRKELNGLNSDGIFLFSLNNINCFLVWDCPEPNENQYIYHEINFFRTIPQKEIAWAGIVGFQLMNWYENNKFCGKCGVVNVIKKNERAIECPSCQNTIYPKISPAVIVAIICKDKILLAQGVNFRSNYYSLVAGYADIGESLEDTVIREVKEEVGLDVKNIRYYKSQPWPFSSSMMIGYIAEADDRQPVIVDQKEISEAAWFKRGSLPNHPSLISIAGEIIEKFEKGEI